MEKDYLKIAGNIHLSYYVEAADLLGIDYEIVIRRMTARFFSNNTSWYINTTVVPINPAPSSRLARAKHLSHDILLKAGLPVPAQRIVRNEEEAVAFFEEKRNIVIKPSQNIGGKGVSILPHTKEDVEDAYEEAADRDRHGRVLVEEYIQGTNYRILVLDTQVIGIVRRLAANITGDGTSCIKTLIEKENAARLDRLIMPIPMDNETIRHIQEQGYELESTIEEGKTIYLRKNANITTGGETEECEAVVHQYYKDLAIKAVKELGLKLGGVDLIAQDITQPGPCAINEVNYNPGLRLHYKVDIGEPKKVAVPIMEYIRKYYGAITNIQ